MSVAARGAWAPAGLSTTIRPGSLVALTGASGAGKTTTTQVLLGLLPADRGRVRVVPAPEGDGLDGAVDLSEIDPGTWWEQIVWVPQRPTITPGTVLENVLSNAPGDTAGNAAGPVPAELVEAARATGFDEVVAGLPQGWDTLVGSGGVGLSVGQRQRLALTRALCSTRPWWSWTSRPRTSTPPARRTYSLRSARCTPRGARLSSSRTVRRSSPWPSRPSP